MDKIAKHQSARGDKVIKFADDHPDLVADGDAAEDIAIIRTEVANLNRLGGSQQTSGQLGKGTTARTNEIVREISADLRSIARTFRRIKKRNPDLAVTFEVPESRADIDIRDAARAFVTNATPLKSKFTARGMDEEFLDDLADLADEFDELNPQQGGHYEDRADDTAAITTSVDNLVDAIEDLDDILTNRLKSDAETLGSWKRASARGKIPRNPKAKTTTPSA